MSLPAIFASFFGRNDWTPWSRYPGAFICDCGPFLGEWPPAGIREIPLDCFQLELMICLPPPSGSLTDVLNFAYPTVYSRPYRFRLSDTETIGRDAYDVQFTAGAAPVPGPTFPGAHLYAVWYSMVEGAPPSALPLTVVPQGMVPGSTAPAFGSRRDGHWSGWMTGDIHAGPANITDTNGFRRLAGASMARTVETDVMPMLATARDMIDDLPNSQYGAVSFSAFLLAKDSLIYTPSQVAGVADIGVPMGIVDADQQLYTRVFLPAYLASKEFGVDYLPPLTHDPQYDSPADYEGGDSNPGTILEWLDWNVGGKYFAYADAVTAGATASVSYKIVAYAADTPPTWALAEPFTVLGSVTIPVGTALTILNWAQTVVMDGAGAESRWTVALLPAFLDPAEPTGLADFPTPGGSSVGQRVLESSMSINSSAPASLGVNAGVNFDTTHRCFRTSPPTVRVQDPQYRYWIPGPVPAYIPLGDLAVAGSDRPPIIFW